MASANIMGLIVPGMGFWPWTDWMCRHDTAKQEYPTRFGLIYGNHNGTLKVKLFRVKVNPTRPYT